ncbi:ABC transporter permease [Catenovulum sp. SM1970]|uniref:ABC transporter permease n=1 Tax=Marinifaba aquimaris TaxID=2741323 RepID=UPI00157299AE|nr:ABC transporter permease [Marinifaba aquimaris]NTS77661.1 ABC transporter permease [Marinifaba aquimaris]
MIKTIFLKELLELLRDKKTLVFMVVLPLLIFPALFGTVAVLAGKQVQQEQTRVLNYYIANEEQAADFAKLMKADDSFSLFEPSAQEQNATWEQWLRAGKVDFVLAVSDTHQSELEQHTQSHWQLHFNNAELTSSVWSRVYRLVEKFNQQITSDKFNALGLNESQYQGVIQPIVLEKKDIAKKKESLGTQLGGIIAYIILPLCLMGAIYPAIDLGAGEKEHGTLESLIITPTHSVAIVLGKFLTIVTTSFTCAFMTVLSLLLWGFIFAQALAVEAVVEIVKTLGVIDMMLALVMLIPVVLFFSALVLAISIYARSFKEAQNYMGPLTILVIAPLVIAMLPGINLDWQWAWVPITNVALSVKEILKGQFDLVLVGFVWLSQVAMAMLMLAFTMFWFKREAVLFR